MKNNQGMLLGAPIQRWLGDPRPQYVNLADVNFGSPQIVMPSALPPSGAIFPNASFNKMNNIPGVMTIDYGSENERFF